MKEITSTGALSGQIYDIGNNSMIPIFPMASKFVWLDSLCFEIIILGALLQHLVLHLGTSGNVSTIQTNFKPCQAHEILNIQEAIQPSLISYFLGTWAKLPLNCPKKLVRRFEQRQL